MFDLGAQHSFISQNISDSLNLPKIGSRQFSVSTLGNSVAKIAKSNNAEFQLTNHDVTVDLQGYPMPFICNSLEAIKLPENIESEFQKFKSRCGK